jgi:hypothetical protein
MGRFFVGGVCCGGYFKSLESALYLILLLLPHLGKERCFIALISICSSNFFFISLMDKSLLTVTSIQVCGCYININLIRM